MSRSEAAKPKRLAKKAAKKVKPLTMDELVRWAESHRACADGLARAQEFSTPAEWWEAGYRGDISWAQAQAWTTHDDCMCVTCVGRKPWPDVEVRIIAEVRR